MKKTGLLAMITAGIMLVTTGCGTRGTGKTAIEVGDVKVTMNDVSLFLQSGDGFDESKQNYVELMEETFKYGELGKAMEIELTDEDKESITMSKAQFAQRAGGLKAFKSYLSEVGSSMEFLDKLFTASAYQSKVTDKIQEEMGDVEPTDDEIKEYFLNNYYRAKHILINIEEEDADSDGADTEDGEEPEETPLADEEGRTGKELADALLERAKNGEDFDELIEKYNQDPGEADQPDGYIFTDGTMMKAFEDCVKSLEPGEFGICETSYGYHVIQRLPLTEEEANFSQWFEDNKSSVASEAEDKKLEDKVDELCDKYNIKSTINQEVVDSFTEDMLVEMPA